MTGNGMTHRIKVDAATLWEKRSVFGVIAKHVDGLTPAPTLRWDLHFRTNRSNSPARPREQVATTTSR